MAAALACSASLASACASSALIRQDDRVFARAAARMERTADEVERSGADARERALFLQAEGFYRYRYEHPRRGGASILAEAAAAITDFPALQSLAGSLDFVELRLRAPDAAVQLWETLLRRNPASPLRPLVLYRLGWAYRNAGAAGLPRDSGEEAFAELLAQGPPPRLAELTRAASATPSKSRSSAATWSLVPGLGQMYAGETLNGSVRLGIALLSAAAFVTPVVVGYERRSELTFRHDWPLFALGLAGLVSLSVDYTSSYEDAMRAVVHWNEAAEASFEDAHADAP